MRISDWSSDVCSSDLTGSPELIFASYSWARRLHMVRLARLRPFRVVRAVSIILRLDSLRRPELAAFSTRSEEHTSVLQSLMRISYAVFCLKKKTKTADILLKQNRYVAITEMVTVYLYYHILIQYRIPVY